MKQSFLLVHRPSFPTLHPIPYWLAQQHHLQKSLTKKWCWFHPKLYVAGLLDLSTKAVKTSLGSYRAQHLVKAGWFWLLLLGWLGFFFPFKQAQTVLINSSMAKHAVCIKEIKAHHFWQTDTLKQPIFQSPTTTLVMNTTSVLCEAQGITVTLVPLSLYGVNILGSSVKSF